MNHTDKLILLPMERYEMLKRLALAPQIPSKKEKMVEEEPEKKSMSLQDIMKMMKDSDRHYASKILNCIDPSLWNEAGVLVGVDLPVQDLILDLKNAENDPPLLITEKRRQAIKHFIFKHTDIQPSLIMNHKYVPDVKHVNNSVLSVKSNVKTSVVPVKSSVKKPTMQFTWQERR